MKDDTNWYIKDKDPDTKYFHTDDMMDDYITQLAKFVKQTQEIQKQARKNARPD